ncbi:MAG: guanylate kinase [Clostridia bacterium]|nr:Guanylate kinase [Clostridiales bacterium]MDK2985976.1 guanylate kinase [Clostridia bacterium]
MKTPSLLIVLSGPSGAGKGTLSKLLVKEMPNLYCSVSATTRPKREGEVDGVNYYFISEEEFMEMKAKGEFLEWAKVYDNYYGTPIKKVEEQLRKGNDVLLEIDIQGALQVKKRFSKGVFIFIVPPSIDELKRRIIKRGTDPQEVINKRMSCVQDELSYVSEYDYVVVNDNLETALEKLKAIITAEKCRPHRQKICIE